MKRFAAATISIIGVLIFVDGSLAQTPDKSGVKPSVLSLPSGPGSIEGLGESFEPQLNTGGSTYSVGFAVPPGRAGLQPSLALAYHSGLGNSYVGVGWSLSLPTIKRQTDKGFPQYNLNDTFLFGGEELVPLSDGTYRCENETSFQRFQPIDSNDDQRIDAWEMTDRNGTKHFFGRFRGENGRWSAVVHPDPPSTTGSQPHDMTYCWALDQTVDLHGNRIEYEYTLGTGKLYPLRIHYSHSEKRAHEIVFEYENRPDDFDDYRPTFSCRIDRRLQRVRVLTGGQPVRSYQLAYEYADGDLTPLTPDEQAARSNAFDLGVSVLKRVTQWDRTGEHHLPPLIFYYSFIGPNLDSATVRRGISPTNRPPELDLANVEGHIQVADINGDGLPDIFSTKPDGVIIPQEVCINEGLNEAGDLRFSSPITASENSSLDLSALNAALTDANADGVVDFCQLVDEFTGKRMDVYQNRTRLDFNDNAVGFGFDPFIPSSQTFIQNAPAYVSFSDPMTRSMDVNFDKVSDFLHTRSEFAGLAFDGHYRIRGGTWSEFHTQTTIPNSYTFDRPASATDDVSVKLADMNGDRLLDFVVLQRSEGQITVSYWPYCALGQWGDRRVMAVRQGDGFRVGDEDLRDFFVRDFTGDGLADVLQLKGGGDGSSLVLRINIAGTSWSSPITKDGLPNYRPRDANGVTVFRTADLNANGSTDLIWRNTSFGDDTWQWLDLMPDAGKPNLLERIDNSIGKVTEIRYGNAHEDLIRARNKNQPWTTKIPFAVQVVRQIRTRCGYDLNGDGREDTYISEFQYRDGFYDGIEKEFRGFAFAQRIDYGDDFLWDDIVGVIGQSSGWNQGRTPTGQVSGPTLVTRYRFHTGAADQQDNDESPPDDPGVGYIDEITETAGKEEECLKGKQLLEEKVDPWVLHNQAASDFDAAARAAVLGGDLFADITADEYVYTRVRQRWVVRRLYRPQENLLTFADQNADGVLSSLGDVVPLPSGRFDTITTLPGNGRSVTFTFIGEVETDVIEANGLLTTALDYAPRERKQTLKEFDYDDFGNAVFAFDHGILGAGFDDERKVVTTYALGGNALSLWVIDKPDTVTTTDEDGAFVNKTIHYYDGEPFVGESGRIISRALLHRVERFIDETTAIDEQRMSYDAFGNVVTMRDPNHGTAFAAPGGHERTIDYDNSYHTYPVRETILVGSDRPELTLTASYDFGFGVVIDSTDFNQNVTLYEYDSFARLVAVIKPGDNSVAPTQLFEYKAFDPNRALRYSYARSGALTKSSGGREANRVTVHARETSGGGVYTTASYTDGCGKTIAEVGEDETADAWIVNKATSFNLRGEMCATWLPYQVAGGDPGVPPPFAAVWPNGRPPLKDDVNPAVVKSDTHIDPLGRGIKTIQPPEQWGGVRKIALTHILPFESHLFDENDADTNSKHADTPHVHLNDGLGRLIGTQEVVKLTDDGETGPATVWETLYTYDLNNKLTQIVDSQGNTKVMRYDGLARKTFMDDPDRGIMQYVYDDASNLIQTTDAKGQVIDYTYDGVNRITTEDYRDESQAFTFGYDYDPSAALTPANRPDVAYFYDIPVTDLDLGDGTTGTAANPLGQLCAVWDLAGEEHFSYDERGRLAWQVKRVPDALLSDVLVSYQTRYAYDSLDRVTELIYPDSDQVIYTYNARNLLESISGGPSGSIIHNIDYKPSSQLATCAYGNGVTTTYEYDPRLRMRDLDTDSLAVGKLIDYSYGFDPVSNITRIDDNRDLAGQVDANKRKNTQVFQYDDLYRLTQVVYPAFIDPETDGKIDYRYDRIGNMLKKGSNIEHLEDGRSVTDLGVMSYGADLGASGRGGRGTSAAGPHALSGVGHPTLGNRAYTYDLNGNMTEIDGLTCQWDFEDRLVEARNEEMTARYFYDHADRRVIKEVTKEIVEPSDLRQEASRTLYINRYFEIRPGEPPVKYVWNGDTRVARITTQLTPTSEKTQRFRVHHGWNLVAFNLAADHSDLDPEQHPLLDAAFHWDGMNNKWQPFGSGTLAAHTPVWLHAAQDGVVGISGDYTEPQDIQIPAGQPAFIANSTELPIHTADLPTDADVWFWDTAAEQWRLRLGGDLAGVVDELPETLEAEAVIYARSATGGVIEVTLEATIQIRYYHQDHLGSSNTITDADGHLVEETANYPFGAPRQQHQPRGLNESYQFTQKERDKESRLQYFEARYLATSLGQFLSADDLYAEIDSIPNDKLITRLANPQHLNLYGYVLRSPLNYSDPTGLDIHKLNRDQQKFAMKALNKAVSKLDFVIRDLEEHQYASIPEDKIIKRFIGSHAATNKEPLIQDLKAVRDHLKSFNIKNIRYDDKTKAYAYVYPNKANRIYVGDKFFKAGNKGFDTAYGTLIHEDVHFNKVVGAKDIRYGVSNAENLARSKPESAISNADNFEYFVEAYPEK